MSIRTWLALAALLAAVTLITASHPGRNINGRSSLVASALDNKVIHPYSDLLPHDIGTGDGVPHGAASEAGLSHGRLWGLRTRLRLMHDGPSLTVLDAVFRYQAEALDPQRTVGRLSGSSLERLLTFLRSL